jgi:hypothetical protein
MNVLRVFGIIFFLIESLNALYCTLQYWTALCWHDNAKCTKIAKIKAQFCSFFIFYLVVLEPGRHGGSVVAHLTVVLQSRVRIRCLPSPQLTANLLVGCHLGWHLAACWPLWGATEEKIMRNEPLVRQKHIKKKKSCSRTQVLPITLFCWASSFPWAKCLTHQIILKVQ